MPLPEEGEVERYPRSAFLGAATLGVGGVIGGLVTVPVLGFTILPAFTSQGSGQVDVGAVDDFEKEQWLITTFLQDPDQGEVSRRTAYIRNNGELDGQPSFTILSHRCVHLGCPVQPNGPVRDDEATRETRAENEITRIPADPSGFGCPCHGGQYDTEGNRKAGPPVRAMDRYEFSIRGGRLLLGQTYSVSEVRGQGAEARIKRHRLAKPGVHVDGPSSWLYPISPP